MSRGLLLALAVTACALPLRAQYPAQIEGVVTDKLTKAPLEGVSILVTQTAQSTLSDAAGRFRLRATGEGIRTLRVERIGYASVTMNLHTVEGETRRVEIALALAPVSLPLITADAVSLAGNATRLDRQELLASGARTVGDALRNVQGVVIRATGPGSAQRISIRGAPEDAALVLVDGVSINDPVTGEADLSTIDIAFVESITVIPGGASSRFGGRAAAGVVLIETRTAAHRERYIALAAGSLDARNASLVWSAAQPVPWTLGASWNRITGSYAFSLPPEAGGGDGVRSNADARDIEAHASTTLRVGTSQLDIRTRHNTLKRGLPGRGYAPSLHARQRYERSNIAASWRAEHRSTDVSLMLGLARQRIQQEDPQPPFGDPFDDVTLATAFELRTDINRRVTPSATVGFGAQVRHQDIRSNSLNEDVKDHILDVGVLAHGELMIAGFLRAALQLRADRDPIDHAWTGTHSVTAAWSNGTLAAHAAHRSSFSPPTLGDRYFRDGVGIAPNPDLRAERIPGEIEAGLRMQLRSTPVLASLSATAFRGDIDRMILWAPDYRFIWSPYNADVKRSGLEAGLQLESQGGRLRVDGSWTMTRTTYDRGQQDDNVQVAYRPRHAALLSARVMLGSLQGGADLRYTGDRTTAPTAVNRLPGFWTTDAAISHAWRWGAWSAVFDLRVQRLFDEKDALIFGFPEPGRTIHAGIRFTHGFSAPDR